MRAKISVLNKGISALDEHLHHLILDKTSFSRQVRTITIRSHMGRL